MPDYTDEDHMGRINKNNDILKRSMIWLYPNLMRLNMNLPVLKRIIQRMKQQPGIYLKRKPVHAVAK